MSQSIHPTDQPTNDYPFDDIIVSKRDEWGKLLSAYDQILLQQYNAAYFKFVVRRCGVSFFIQFHKMDCYCDEESNGVEIDEND